MARTQTDNKHLNGYVDEGRVHFPACRFCGKETLPIGRYDNEDEADEAATLHCDCYDARKYQEDKRRAELRQKNIERLQKNVDAINDYCTEHNVKLSDEFRKLIINCGTAVIDRLVDAASIKSARLSVKLSTNSKSTVVIKVTYSDGTTYEV